MHRQCYCCLATTTSTWRHYLFVLIATSLLLYLAPISLQAEGTNQLAPNGNTFPTGIQNDVAALYINADAYSNFAAWNGADPNSRLYINVQANECIYLGFSEGHLNNGYNGCPGHDPATDYNPTIVDYEFRVLDPNGNVVFGPQAINSGTANITSWSDAMRGPTSTGGTGYTPFMIPSSSLPATGDYYIEFQCTNGCDAEGDFLIDYFDITIGTCESAAGAGDGTANDGRVWSFNWALFAINDNCFPNRPFNGSFFVCAPDPNAPSTAFITRIDFNGSGFKPAAFNVAFNSTGTMNTGNVIDDRMSVENQNTTRPEYAIYLNDPIDICQDASFGQATGNSTVSRCGQNEFCIFVQANAPGIFEVLIDLEGGNGTYDPGTADVLLGYEIPAGGPFNTPTCVPWDGLDGLGNAVTDESIFVNNVYVDYIQGVFHFPIYDAELLETGFTVSFVRPLPPNAPVTPMLYFDDSNLADGNNDGANTTSGIDGQPQAQPNGCQSPCHGWSNYTTPDAVGFGNLNTINTYWFTNRVDVAVEASLPDYVMCRGIDGMGMICPGAPPAEFTADVVALPNGNLPADVSYAWTGPSGFTATGISTGSISEPGEYTLTVSWGGECVATCAKTLSISPDQDCCILDITCPDDERVQCEGDIPNPTPMELLAYFMDNSLINDFCKYVNITATDTNNGGTGCSENPLVITRTYTITDSLNTSNCTHTFTVVDSATPSSLACPSDLIINCGDGDILTAINNWLATATAADNCGNARVESNFDPNMMIGNCGPNDQIMVTFSAVDQCGNGSSSSRPCTANIIINDNGAPTITCAENITGLACTDSIPAPDISTITVSDDCTPASEILVEWVSDDDNGADGCGENPRIITRTYRATDNCGNASTCTQRIRFRPDNQNPNLNCPDNLSLTCDQDILTEINAWLATATATDDCAANGSVPVNNNFDPAMMVGNCGAEGMITITFTATDECGNAATCDKTITITDNTNPIITCADNITGLACTDSIPAPDISSVTVSDNCTPANEILVEWIGDEDNGADGCGENPRIITRTYQATDNCGNISTCTQRIRFRPDNQNPNLNCPSDLTLDCAQDILAEINTWLNLATVTDNCTDAASITLTNNFDPAMMVGMCGAEGMVTVTFTATDECGNTSTCDRSIMVNDNTNPIITCAENITGLTCTDSIPTPDISTVIVSDNCTPDSEILVEWIGDEDNGGDGCGENPRIITRTYQATDNCGNTSVCRQRIRFRPDNQNPDLNCPSNLTLDCAQDILTEINAWLNLATATDNCAADGSITVTNNFDPAMMVGMCGEEGMVTVTFTATDACGNTSTCDRTIMVNDNTNPIITCAENITGLVCTDDVPAPDISTVIVSDNCTPDNEILVEWIGDEDNGENGCPNTPRIIVRTYQATDNCGNTSVCRQRIRFRADNQNPDLVCPSDLTLDCAQDILAEINTWLNLATATDNCSDAGSITINNNFDPAMMIGNCGAEGTVIVTFTATDICGNTATCDRSITVNDNTNPIITCAENITGLACTDAVPAPDISTVLVSDNCTPDSEILVEWIGDQDNAASGCPGDARVIVRTYQATDNCGNTSVCRQRIRFRPDNQKPDLNCPSNLTLDCAQDILTEINTWLNLATATDNCSDAASITLTNNFDPAMMIGMCGAEGTVTITFTATDACGNVATCDRTIMINDNTKPIISCAPNITDLDCNAEVPAPDISSVLVSDNCTPDNEIVVTWIGDEDNSASGCPGDARVIVRTYQAADNCGNTSTCKQRIRFKPDNEKPALTCPQNLALNCDDDVLNAINTWLATATATDNCSDAGSIAITNDFDPAMMVGNCGEEGMITVTFTATDECGNAATCKSRIRIRDKGKPFISCAPAITGLDCIADVPAPDISTVIVSDNCTPTDEILVEWLGDEDNGANGCQGNPRIIIRTYQATDKCGNTATCNQRIRFKTDGKKPDLNCPSDLTLDCAQDILAEINIWLALATATDNCTDDASLTVTNNFDPAMMLGMCGADEAVTITFTATDACGNTATCDRSIIISDKTQPFISCPPNITDLACTADVPAPDISTVIVSDNCTPDNEIVVEWIGDQENGGSGCPGDARVVVRTYQATDNCGNISVCKQRIRFKPDNQAPSISCPSDLTLACDDPQRETKIKTWLNGVTATDNCASSVSVNNDYDPSRMLGNCGEAGKVLITFTATDDCGNIAEKCTAYITVTDDKAPVLTGVPPDLTVSCDMIPDASASSVSATDNCDTNISVQFNEETTNQTCPHTYNIIRTWSAKDECGNETSQSQTIRVKDTQGPVINCPTDLTLACDAPDQVTQIQAWLNGVTATDNCSDNVTVNNDYDPNSILGNCGEAGKVLITFTAKDDCGNAAQSCSAYIIITDDKAPVLTGVPPDLTVSCDAIPDPVTSVAATDNCDNNIAVDFSQEIIKQTCPHTYDIIRTWSATDECGNETEQSQTIQVKDTQGPVIKCPTDLTLACDAPDQAGQIKAWLNGVTATDNCSFDITVNNDFDPNSMLGSCGEAGKVLVTFTAKDECGNAAQSCSAYIMVVDDEAPVLTCKDLHIPCSEPNRDEQVQAWFNKIIISATDNCDDDLDISHNYDPNNFVEECGYWQMVTITAVDDCGNQSECTIKIVLVDESAPTINCEDLFIPCHATDREAQIQAWLSGTTATDDCDEHVTVHNNYDPDAFVEECGYWQMITFTATDNCGNKAECTAKLMLVDEKDPVVHCPVDLQIPCHATDREAQIQAWLVGVTGSDDCDPSVDISNNYDPNAFVEECGFWNMVTFTAKDNCGHTATCQAKIILVDEKDPVVHCPADLEIPCHATDREAQVQAWLAGVTGSDDCDPSVDISNNYDPNAFVEECGYWQMVTFTAKDNCGHTATCQAKIILVDEKDPVVNCPADLQIPCHATDREAQVQAWLAGVTGSDDCDPSVEISNNYSADGFVEECGYWQMVTFTAKDNCGHTATCQAKIILVDEKAPTISCEDLLIPCHAADKETLIQTWLNGTKAHDDCDVNVTVNNNYDPNAFVEECGFWQIVTFTAKDNCGNAAECSAKLMLIDELDPVVNCPSDLEIPCDAADKETLIQAWLTAVTGTDECDPSVDITNNYDPNAFVEECGFWNMVTFTARDNCGHKSTCQAKIILVDEKDPVVHCPADLEIPCHATDREAQVQAWLAGVTGSDECDPSVEISNNYDSNAFVEECGFWQMVTFTAKDNCGHTATCQAKIILVDEKAPTISCEDLLIPCHAADKEARIQAWLSGTKAYDDCDVNVTVNNNYDPNAFVEECGFWQIVTFTAKDNCGNTAECSAKLMLIDELDPTISCPADLTIECGDPETDWLIQEWLNSATGTDECDPSVEITNDYSADNFVAECGNSKWIMVTFTARDNCGHKATCQAKIIIQDTTKPTFTGTLPPTPITMTYEEFNKGYQYPILSATDNCGEAKATGPEVVFKGTCDDYRAVLTWRAKDECGNSTTFTQIIYFSNTEPSCYITTPTNIVCGEKTILHAQVSGGIPPYTYQWIQTQGNWTLSGSNNNSELQVITNYSSASFELRITDARGCTTTCNVKRNCQDNSSQEYCTFTQGFYGNAGGIQNGQTTLEIIQDALSQDINGDGNNLNDPLVLGIPGSSLTIGYYEAACIIDLLPGSGPSIKLPTGDVVLDQSCEPWPIVTNAQGRLKNNLLTQTIALALNVRYDAALCHLKLRQSCLSIPSDIYTGIQQTLGIKPDNATVCDLLALANKALGGLNVGASLGSITEALGAVNDGFNECKTLCDGGEKSSEEDVSQSQSRISMTPVPAQHTMNISFEASKRGKTYIYIYDHMGQPVKYKTFNAQEGLNHSTMEVNDLPIGIYVIKIYDGKEWLTDSFTKS